MKSKYQKQQEALRKTLESINLWNSNTFKSSQDWMQWLFVNGAKGKSWDEFRAAKVKNLERDVRNLQAKGVTVSGY